MIDVEHALPVKRQAQLVGISRSTVYRKPRPVSSADLVIMREIDELHLESPFAGSRMICSMLKQNKHEIDRSHRSPKNKTISCLRYHPFTRKSWTKVLQRRIFLMMKWNINFFINENEICLWKMECDNYYHILNK